MTDVIIIEFECDDCRDLISHAFPGNWDVMRGVCECGNCQELYAINCEDGEIDIYTLENKIFAKPVSNLHRENPCGESELEMFENPTYSRCPVCDMKYDDFRTGETFQTVLDDLWVASDRPEDWNYKRRSSVLGKWHEIKQLMWAGHISECEAAQEWEEAGGTLEDDDDPEDWGVEEF